MPSGFDPKMSEEQVDEWLGFVRDFLQILAARKKQQFNRRVSVSDLLTERTDNAAGYGIQRLGELLPWNWRKPMPSHIEAA